MKTKTKRKEIDDGKSGNGRERAAESREHDKAGKSQIVVVDLGEAQSTRESGAFAKERGEADDASSASSATMVRTRTVKSSAQPVVIVVRGHCRCPSWREDGDD
jgi:hypothetical protein